MSTCRANTCCAWARAHQRGLLRRWLLCRSEQGKQKPRYEVCTTSVDQRSKLHASFPTFESLVSETQREYSLSTFHMPCMMQQELDKGQGRKESSPSPSGAWAWACPPGPCPSRRSRPRSPCRGDRSAARLVVGTTMRHVVRRLEAAAADTRRMTRVHNAMNATSRRMVANVGRRVAPRTKTSPAPLPRLRASRPTRPFS